jgi:hypothetical protein
MNKVVMHAFLKEEQHVYTEQMGEQSKNKNGMKNREKMAPVQKNSSRAL